MAKRSSKATRGSAGPGGAAGAVARSDAPALSCPLHELLASSLADPEGRTGRYIAVMRPEAEAEADAVMNDHFAATSARSSDFSEHSFDVADITNADTLMLDTLGIVILGGAAAEAARDRSAITAEGVGLAAELPYILVPETIEWAQVDNASYLRGFRAAANQIAADLMGDIAAPPPDPGPAEIAAAIAHTWGLGATRVAASALTGRVTDPREYLAN